MVLSGGCGVFSVHSAGVWRFVVKFPFQNCFCGTITLHPTASWPCRHSRRAAPQPRRRTGRAPYSPRTRVTACRFFWYTRTVFLLYCWFCTVYRGSSGTAVPMQISEPALAAVLVRVYKRETQQRGSSQNPWCSAAWLQCVAAPLLGRAHVGARGGERCAVCARWSSVKCVAPRA